MNPEKLFNGTNAEPSSNNGKQSGSSSMPTLNLMNLQNTVHNNVEDMRENEGGSNSDLEIGRYRNNFGNKRKASHRHTPEQISELEKLFKITPHPAEKERIELGKRIGLDKKPIKFWFQNRRTQLKTQVDRYENGLLHTVHEKLQVENASLRKAFKSPTCNSCDSRAMFQEVSLEQQRLLIENAQLQDQLNIMSALTEKFLKAPPSTMAKPIKTEQARPSSLPQHNIRTDSSNVQSSGSPDTATINSPTSPAGSVSTKNKGILTNEKPDPWDKVASAMDELLQMAQMEQLWIPASYGRMEKLNTGAYNQRFRRSSTAMSSNVRCFTAATRDTMIVNIDSLSLVETFMDSACWGNMFPCMIARATDSEVLYDGIDETKNHALLQMQAEFQFHSPLVPLFEVSFLRFAKQFGMGKWAVVDVSTDETLSTSGWSAHCRRLPSGFLVKDMSNGYSKITWVEHMEYDENLVHELYQPLLRSGLAFGAAKWLSMLQFQCDKNSIFKSSTVVVAGFENDFVKSMTVEGQRSILKLSQRMTKIFCNGVSASNTGGWSKIQSNRISENVQVMKRKSLRKRGEPTGIVLSVAISVVIPVKPQVLFDFLQNGQRHGEWDILSNEASTEIARIDLDHRNGNSISLLHAMKKGSKSSTMIVQETRSDSNGSMLVVYTTVDMPDMKDIIAGGDSSKLPILPCGFAVAPIHQASDGSSDYHNGIALSCRHSSLLTVSVQVLVSDQPSKLTLDSIETMDRLVTCTVHRIMAAVTS